MLMALAHHHGNLEEVISNSAGASARPIKAPESRGSIPGPSAPASRPRGERSVRDVLSGQRRSREPELDFGPAELAAS
ncbi:hypothetical protein AOLI_G00163230 [Acnodon oligacanthus]